MKKVLTTHDVLGTIEGLQEYGLSLREAALGKVHDIAGVGTGVLVDPVAITAISGWLFDAAAELRLLIPEGPLVAFKSKQRTQTLVRVVAYHPVTEMASVVLPGWNPDTVLTVPLPKHLASKIKKPTEANPFRCTAWVNLGAQSSEDLEFSDWAQ